MRRYQVNRRHLLHNPQTFTDALATLSVSLYLHVVLIKRLYQFFASHFCDRTADCTSVLLRILHRSSDQVGYDHELYLRGAPGG